MQHSFNNVDHAFTALQLKKYHTSTKTVTYNHKNKVWYEYHYDSNNSLPSPDFFTTFTQHACAIKFAHFKPSTQARVQKATKIICNRSAHTDRSWHHGSSDAERERDVHSKKLVARSQSCHKSTTTFSFFTVTFTNTQKSLLYKKQNLGGWELGLI